MNTKTKITLTIVVYSMTLCAGYLGYLIGDAHQMETKTEIAFNALQEQSRILAEMSDFICKVNLSKIESVQHDLDSIRKLNNVNSTDIKGK